MEGTILIIEDDEQVLKLLKRRLEKNGYNCITATDGKIGIDTIESNEYEIDLVITDMIMPNQEGMKTILDIQSNFPQIKIIAMSGGGRIGAHDYLAAAKELGADGIISKPIDNEDFLTLIANVLNKRK